MAQPRKTRVDWRPRYAFAPPKDHDYGDQDIIEGEFTELADAPASGGSSADLGASSSAGQGSETGCGARSGEDESGGEGWAEEAYPQDQGGSAGIHEQGEGCAEPNSVRERGRPRGPNSRLEPGADE